MDGLRRCSDSSENQRSLPGRNAITFLIVANLVVYVFELLLSQSNIQTLLTNQSFSQNNITTSADVVEIFHYCFLTTFSLKNRGGRRDYTLKLEEVIGIICSLLSLITASLITTPHSLLVTHHNEFKDSRNSHSFSRPLM